MSNSLLLGFSGKKLISAPKSKIILFQISIYWLWRRYAYWPSIYLYNIWYCSKWNRTRRFDWPAQTAWSWNLDGRRPFAEPCYWYWANWRRIYSGFVWLDRLWPYNLGHILWAMDYQTMKGNGSIYQRGNHYEYFWKTLDGWARPVLKRIIGHFYQI